MTRQALSHGPTLAASVYDGARLAGTVEISERDFEAGDADGAIARARLLPSEFPAIEAGER